MLSDNYICILDVYDQLMYKDVFGIYIQHSMLAFLKDKTILI